MAEARGRRSPHHGPRAAGSPSPGQRRPDGGRLSGSDPHRPAPLPRRDRAPDPQPARGRGRAAGGPDRIASGFRARLAGPARRPGSAGPARRGKGSRPTLARGRTGLRCGNRRRHGLPAQPAGPAIRSARAGDCPRPGRQPARGRDCRGAAWRRRPDPASGSRGWGAGAGAGDPAGRGRPATVPLHL